MSDKETKLLPILEVNWDDKNQALQFVCDDTDSAVLLIAEGIVQGLKQNQDGPLNALLAILLHLFAMESSGKLEREFMNNLKKFLPEYRKQYEMINLAGETTMQEEQ